MAQISIYDDMTALVHNFLGFDEDWNEITISYDRDAVEALRAQGYTVEFASDDI